MSPADGEKTYRIGGRNPRWPVWTFGLLGVAQLIAVFVQLANTPRAGRWGNVVVGLVLGVSWPSLALGFARMHVTTSPEGVTILQQTNFTRRFRWSEVAAFSIRGDISPTGFLERRNGRSVRIAALTDGFNIRRRPPSDELRAIVASLETDRQRWTQPHIAV